MSHAHGPPPEERIRRRERRRDARGRDLTPAVGTRGQPGAWGHEPGAGVAGARPRWADARWSFLYDKGTGYARRAAANGRVRAAARRARGGDRPTVPVNGPVINAAVWTWEVPLYFWFGGVATGSSFVAMACDAVGDHRSAALARKLTLGAVLPGAPLLVLDLGRPLRFLHMLRIFKVRSPMSMGAWCLSAFSGAAFGAVAADVLGRPRLARVLGIQTAVFGTYLGSYTGVLLASTAVPLWNRSRAFLPPVFICTGVGGGAAANRLLLAAAGTPADHPARRALGIVETAAMGAELVLSTVNERRLGRLARALEEGRPGTTYSLAKWGVRAGLMLRLARGRGGPALQHVASALFLLAGVAFRFAWVGAGRTSAHDDEAVALTARSSGRRGAGG
jgi:formate-dependent nitrite reductase membrane component NrfD